MSWIKTAKEQEQKAKPNYISIMDVKSGQVFSLTEDSRPFRMGAICKIAGTDGVERDFVEVRSADTGAKELFPVADYQEVPVVIRQDPNLQEKVQARYYDYDRVLYKRGNGVKGTVIAISSSRYPDINATVLLDSMVDGKWVVDCCTPDIEPVKNDKGQTVIDDRGEEIREIASMVKETRRDGASDHNKGLMAKLHTQMAKIASEKVEKQGKIDEATDAEVNEVVAAVLDRWPEDIKNINDAVVCAITSGAHNYEIGQIPEMLRNYAEDVHNKVTRVSSNLDIHVKATEGLLNKVANTAINQYFILRQGYIKPYNTGWAVYARTGELIDKHPNRKKALSQIRAMEWRSNSSK